MHALDSNECQDSERQFRETSQQILEEHLSLGGEDKYKTSVSLQAKTESWEFPHK